MVLTKELLAAKAFDMFRDWTRKAKLYYPEFDFTIIDETLLVNDLLESLNKAKRSLFSKEKKAKRKTIGFDQGFILGYVQGSLNTHWANEYIRKQSPEYKRFIALKAIKNYLAFDELTAVRISALYKHMMEEDRNLNNVDVSIPQIKINQYELDKLEPETDDQIVTALNNEINVYILKTLKEDLPELLNPLQYYFSDEEANCIIHQPLPFQG